MFQDSANNIDKLTTSIFISFIRKCNDNVVHTLKVHFFPNEKPWINTEVGAKLKDRDSAHRAITDNPEATAEDRSKYNKSKGQEGRILLRRLH